MVLAGSFGVDAAEDLLAELERVLDEILTKLDVALGHGAVAGDEVVIGETALRQGEKVSEAF